MPEWFERSSPDAITAKPWLHEQTTAYLESLLCKDMRVLEHGAGGSSLWFAERVKEVVSIEDDPDWLGVLAQRKPDNLTLILEKEGKIPPVNAPFDLMLIDGDPVVNRAVYLTHANELVKPGGWVVVDNYNRPEYAKEMKELMAQGVDGKDFNFNTKSSKYFCTYFMRLPCAKE